MTAAARQKAYRDRRKRAWVLLIEVDDVAVPAALVDAKLLDPGKCEDRKAVATAIENLLRKLSTEDRDA